MNDSVPPSPCGSHRRPAWNKGKLTGPKPPLRTGHIWSIRAKLQLEQRTRDLAMFNLAIDSKLRGCDLVGLRQETTTIPIVMALTPDPVRVGLIANLAQPEGNVTGVAWFGFDILPKRIEFLKEIVPDLKRLAIITNAYGDPKSIAVIEKYIRSAASTLGFAWQHFRPRVTNDFDDGCDLVALRVDDVAPNGYAVDRATIRQRKSGRPVRLNWSARSAARRSRQSCGRSRQSSTRWESALGIAGSGPRYPIHRREDRLASKGMSGRIRRKERESGRWLTMHLAGPEFMRRFLQHVLPKGLHKIRYYGLWHPSRRKDAARARLRLELDRPTAPTSTTEADDEATSASPTSATANAVRICPCRKNQTSSGTASRFDRFLAGSGTNNRAFSGTQDFIA